MKLIIAIVSGDDASEVSSALVKQNFVVTRIESTGGLKLEVELLLSVLKMKK